VAMGQGPRRPGSLTEGRLAILALSVLEFLIAELLGQRRPLRGGENARSLPASAWTDSGGAGRAVCGAGALVGLLEGLHR